jgi:hypothetical protein
MEQLQIGRLILSSRNIHKISGQLARQCSILSCKHPNILINTSKQFSTSDRYILTDIQTKKIIDDYGPVNDPNNDYNNDYNSDLNIFSRLYTLGWTSNGKFYSNLKALNFSYDIHQAHRQKYVRPVITIDPDSSTDLDDGFSIEINGDEINLDIHIADPTSYFDFENPNTLIILKEISKRFSTCYIPLEGKIKHLIPESEKFNLLKHCTLIGSFKRALTFSFSINTLNNQINFQIKPTVLEKIINYSYDSYDLLVNSDVEYKKKLVLTCNLLIKHMGCNLNLIDETTDISHKMIETFMITTNYFTGNYLRKNKNKMCVRIQEKNVHDELLPKNISQLKSLGAKYLYVDNDSTEKYYHSSLQIENYCQVTSPMRRFTDMINHFILYRNNFDLIKQFIEISSINKTAKKYKRISNAYDLVIMLKTTNKFTAFVLDVCNSDKMLLTIHNSDFTFKKIIKCKIPVEYVDLIKKYDKYNVEVYYEPEKFSSNIFPFFVKLLDKIE